MKNKLENEEMSLFKKMLASLEETNHKLQFIMAQLDDIGGSLCSNQEESCECKHEKSDEDEVMEMLNDMFEDLGHITIIRKEK